MLAGAGLLCGRNRGAFYWELWRRSCGKAQRVLWKVAARKTWVRVWRLQELELSMERRGVVLRPSSAVIHRLPRD